MDDPETPENSDNNSEEYDVDEKWNISIEKEKNYWWSYIISIYTYQKDICPKCKNNSLRISEPSSGTILNPIMLRCNSKKCRRKFSIRKFSFLKLHHKIPASIIINVLENFILLKLNAKQLQSMIEKDYKITFSYANILELLKNVSYALADFMKDKYKRNQIGGPPEKEKVVCIEECLMMHENGKQQWVVGAAKQVVIKCDLI